MRIIHISDLHFDNTFDVHQLIKALIVDLKGKVIDDSILLFTGDAIDQGYLKNTF